jgi:hypothetical protein
VEVRGGVFSNRLIAAAYVTAYKAFAKVHPLLPYLEALFAALCACCWLLGREPFKMLARRH